MQFLSAVSPHPFSTPSWKVETKYSTRVLTGNWVEERRKFTKATEKTPQSIYRKEYVPFPGHRPDQISRWYGKRRVEGLPHRHLLAGHQEPCRRHLISTYDDHYNRHSHNPALPARRTWNGHQLLWLPERSDFPLLAPPTNYGLYEQLKRRWLAPKAAPRESIYTSSYPSPPVCAMSRREHAIPVPPLACTLSRASDNCHAMGSAARTHRSPRGIESGPGVLPPLLLTLLRVPFFSIPQLKLLGDRSVVCMQNSAECQRASPSVLMKGN